MLAKRFNKVLLEFLGRIMFQFHNSIIANLNRFGYDWPVTTRTSRRLKPFRIAVLASTRGTTLQALLDEMKGRKLPGVKLVMVASDMKDCGALERAREAGVTTAWVDPRGKKREEFDRELLTALEAADGGKGVDLICLMGFMRILSPEFVRHYRHRILNVHPALLPKYGGKGFLGNKVHEAVLASKDKVTGMTIHFVDEGCDTGPIVHQVEVPVKRDARGQPLDTVETLRGKVQALEKKWYPEIIRWMQHGKVTVDEHCSLCSSLEDEEYGLQKFGWPQDDCYIPAAADRLEIVRGDSHTQLQIRRCPQCGTYYFHKTSYEYLVNGSEDEQILTRLTEKEAKKYLSQKEWW